MMSDVDGEFTMQERAALNEEIETLLGFAAGDYYEGWNQYWDYQSEYEDKLMAWLTQWRALCVEHSSNDE